MTQVKFFEESNIYTLEGYVNDFLKDLPADATVVDIQYRVEKNPNPAFEGHLRNANSVMIRIEQLT